jgi:hypothetical protein
VNDYNENMGFVDNADMLKALHEVKMKSRRWWHNLLVNSALDGCKYFYNLENIKRHENVSD